MRALDEIERLQKKMDAGDLPPDEPLFVLRAQDELAAQLVRIWCVMATAAGTPEQKVREASKLADRMDAWHTKQVPGLPVTRVTS